MGTVMKIQARLATNGDAVMVSGWMRRRGKLAWDPRTLPPTGVVMEIDGVPCAAAWLFITDGYCGVGFLHNLATNPDVSAARRMAAARGLMDVMRGIGLQNGCHIIFGGIRDKRLLKTARRLGWMAGDEMETPVFLKI